MLLHHETGDKKGLLMPGTAAMACPKREASNDKEEY
jgi:hypothetical protein